jgi:Family of unknown function (DUF5754)
MERKIREYERRFPRVTKLQVRPSRKAEKRFRAEFLFDGQARAVDFGLRGATTYFDGAPRKKQKSYQARASKITNAAGQYTYKLPGTANSFSYWLLW